MLSGRFTSLVHRVNKVAMLHRYNVEEEKVEHTTLGYTMFHPSTWYHEGRRCVEGFLQVQRNHNRSLALSVCSGLDSFLLLSVY